VFAHVHAASPAIPLEWSNQMPKLFGKLLLYAAMSLFVACCAHAHDITEGSGVLCDKAAQIEMFAAYDAQLDAVKTINGDAH
jgi:hypothetical protein